MSGDHALLSAILDGHVDSDSDLQQHVGAAAEAGIDLFDYCTHRFPIGETTVMERAAGWAGLAFYPTIPQRLDKPLLRRLDRIASIRAVRGQVFDRDIIYGAPRYEQFAGLAKLVRAQPEVYRSFCVVPFREMQRQLVNASAGELADAARDALPERWPYASARADLGLGARIGFVLGVVVILLVAALAPFAYPPVFVPLIGALLVLPAALRLWAVLSPPAPLPPPPILADAELPIYSVLVPLRDEAHMVPQLAAALRRLDYPAEKLDIAFVVEADSAETVAAVRAELGDPRFRLVEVPPSEPRTKPKAMNFALPTVRGSIVAVYDAEDVPDPGQLRLAASRFAERAELDCLQAELVIENATENRISALFAGEYAGQFGLMLPLLARLQLPMPLGGTSNHFRVAALREVGGWDSYNVTEDADLGVRFSRLRYRTGTIESFTYEEAPLDIRAWLAQRTRWMKGWMQTFIVHNRNGRAFLKDIGWRGFLGFQIYVGSQILSGPLHTLFLVSFLARVTLEARIPFGFWDGASIAVFFAGYTGPVALSLAGLSRLGHGKKMLATQAWLPVYWLLHSVAAVRALGELLTRPYFWSKTRHGNTRLQRKGS